MPKDADSRRQWLARSPWSNDSLWRRNRSLPIRQAATIRKVRGVPISHSQGKQRTTASDVNLVGSVGDASAGWGAGIGGASARDSAGDTGKPICPFDEDSIGSSGCKQMTMRPGVQLTA